MYELDFKTYQDKVLAAWLGKSIGGTVGAYVENHKELKAMSAAELWPPKIPPNDDLDIQLVWFEAMQEKGCWLTSADLVSYWQDRCWYNFCEYGFFLYNVQRGILPPWSGYWNNDFFRESEGCPIRSDIWGLVAPGNPQLAADLARLDGELDHSGFSVEAEMFYAAMSAQALVAKSREEILSAGLSVLPETSKIREVVATTARIAADFTDFSAAWRVLMRCYGDRDASKAITNLAIVMLAWAKSDDDFTKAMVHCANSGWDADCTAATLGAILGAWKGTAGIPAEWREKLGPTLVCGIEVKHKTSPLVDIGYETALLGVEMAQVRNAAAFFRGAPPVATRQAPEPRLELSIDYPHGPVLYAASPVDVLLTLDNPTRNTITGTLVIDAPSNVNVSVQTAALSILPGEKQAVQLRIRRIDATLPLPDKNLFKAWFWNDRGDTAETVFGLGGARQWLVYGPYWNMWDREKYGDECPYAGPGRNCHPGWVKCGIDSYLHYQYLDYAYLDEDALADHDLPDEAPMRLESGIDRLVNSDFGGWHGSACRYFVRTFIAPEGCKMYLNLGRTGQLKVWLDGREQFRSDALHSWALGESDFIFLTGTGKPQRLVVKLVNPTDEAALAIYFLHDKAPDPKHGVSYLVDSLVDVVPTVGYVR